MPASVARPAGPRRLARLSSRASPDAGRRAREGGQDHGGPDADEDRGRPESGRRGRGGGRAQRSGGRVDGPERGGDPPQQMAGGHLLTQRHGRDAGDTGAHEVDRHQYGDDRHAPREPQEGDGHSGQSVGGEEMPIGPGDPVRSHKGRDHGHVGDLEEHGEGAHHRHDGADQPYRRGEEPDQRDERAEQTAGAVGDHQEPSAVDPVGCHTGEQTRDDRGDARESGDDTHLDHRPRAVQHQKRDRRVREGVPEGGQGLDPQEHQVVAIAPRRGRGVSPGRRRRPSPRPLLRAHRRALPFRPKSRRYAARRRRSRAFPAGRMRFFAQRLERFTVEVHRRRPASPGRPQARPASNSPGRFRCAC